jgi:hypothetical protein
MGLATGVGTTVTVKVSLAKLLVASPLFTVTVTVALPDALGAGVKVKVPVLLGAV